MPEMSENQLENSKIQMRKGVLEFCILLIIAKNATYAPEILVELEKVGMVVVEGTLYPLLNRLKREENLTYAWEESTSGPPRKYYSLSPKGKKYLQELKKSWKELNTTIAALEKPKKA